MDNSTPISPVPQDEIWSPIANYEGIYEISNLGRIKHINILNREDRIISPELSHGRFRVRLYKSGIRKTFWMSDLLGLDTETRKTIIPDLPNEIWKDVGGYENIYQVSNLGRVKSSKKIIRATVNKWGYVNIGLSKNGVQKKHQVHRLVALAFLGTPPTPQHQVNHINSFRNDNQVINLEWCTASENAIHSYVNNHRVVKGRFGQPRTKLTPENVNAIKEIVKSGTKQTEAARLYGVAISTVCSIVNGKTRNKIAEPNL